ncbi:hypothetical protein LTR56_025831 [Elasticomyces elasticus]|nr:hypothetical protein LTR56_025831 [Elasticomyces elasticus]KAK3668241.1 hypothetical protein LTR22_000926 [Elasticomyces elasticus]KAK4922732.1 hypothetical protein LTR49_009920 [Elasticomyces elasticus]KAK5769434.1 hypothetical protein LTS12_000361 [Elasticomyces elasticus]
MGSPSQDEWPMDRVLQALWNQSTIEVHNFKGALNARMTHDQLAGILTTDKQRLAISVPNIPHLSGQPSPTAKVDRLRLLEVLIGSTPKSLYINLNTIKFSFLVSKGCFIPPQLNPLSGTWFRCITGQMNYMSIPSSQLTEDDWEALRTDPVKWQRSGDGLQKFIHVPIGPGQTFLTAVANPSVMVFYFPKASYVECGLYWDGYAMRETLQWMQKAYGHPAAAKFRQPDPEQLLAILEQLQIAINAYPNSFTRTCSMEQLQAELQGALKKVGEMVHGERRDSPSAGEERRDSAFAGEERRDSASAGGERRGSVSAGEESMDPHSALASNLSQLRMCG